VPTARAATKADLTDIGAVLARAFHDDPVVCYVQPDDAARARSGPRFWRTLATVATDKGEVWVTDDGAAAALWLAPDRWKDRPRHLVRQLPLAFTLRRSLPRAMRVFSLMERHHPRAPHWYLETLGTDPVHQGKGRGSALMAPVLGRCDAEGLPAYLESSKESNIPFYERHGFEVTGELVLPGGPTLYPMWRDPQPPA
jgi:GNAT superfamily N-acetyltransferase